MKRNLFSTLLLISIFSINLFASGPDKIDNFKLKDYKGKEHSLSDYKDSKAIVVMFVATKCPVSNDYNDRMAALYNDYKNKGISFLGINSNKAEDAEEVKDHAKENGLDFVILKDPNNVIADKFEASFTPEIYVLNGKYDVVYHGRIDDSRKKENIKTQDLRTALDEILSGKEVSVKQTKAFGCTIKRVEK